MRGTVKWFSQEKSFGFIQPEDGSKDVFVHASQLARARITHLPEGAAVEFDKQEAKNGKGHEAVNLRLAHQG